MDITLDAELDQKGTAAEHAQHVRRIYARSHRNNAAVVDVDGGAVDAIVIYRAHLAAIAAAAGRPTP